MKPSNNDFGPRQIMKQSSRPLPLRDRTAPAPSCIFACSVITLEGRKINSKYESPLPMVPPTINFWSVSQKQSLASQQRHAVTNKLLRAKLCSIDTFDPAYNQKKLTRKRTSIIEEVFYNYEQLLQPVQSTA